MAGNSNLNTAKSARKDEFYTQLTELEGDGDFRSPECLTLLDEADIVVTNPPFSLFREYLAVLVEHRKHFIIIGNVNAVKYKEVFPLFMNNELWLGASIHSGDSAFYVPDDYPLDAAGCGIDEETGRKYIRVKGVRWFTNLDIKQRHEEMILVGGLLKSMFEKLRPRRSHQFDMIGAFIPWHIVAPFTRLASSNYMLTELTQP